MTIFRSLRYGLKAAWEILYPRLCLHCQQETAAHQHMFCIYCLHDYVETDYHLIPDNPVAMHFYGRVKIEKATALLDFRKGTLTQTLLHELKYNQRKDIGIALGRRLAEKVEASGFFREVELIMPVPLHRKKLRKRGYNQSALFAQGIQEFTGLRLDRQTLIRRKHTATQTKKSRVHRIDNVSEAFALRNAGHLHQKHILLVDDVITTGATLEACAGNLLELPGTRVSVATIALG